MLRIVFGVSKAYVKVRIPLSAYRSGSAVSYCSSHHATLLPAVMRMDYTSEILSEPPQLNVFSCKSCLGRDASS